MTSVQGVLLKILKILRYFELITGHRKSGGSLNTIYGTPRILTPPFLFDTKNLVRLFRSIFGGPGGTVLVRKKHKPQKKELFFFDPSN